MQMKRLSLSEGRPSGPAAADREWRRYGGLLLIGKLAGVACWSLIGLLPDLLGWQAFAPMGISRATISSIPTLYGFVGSLLVFAMQVGFTMLRPAFVVLARP